MDFLETGLCACEAIGLDPDGPDDHRKRPQRFWGAPGGRWGQRQNQGLHTRDSA